MLPGVAVVDKQAASVDILRQALVCAIWLQCSSKPPPQVCSCSPGTGALKWKWVTFSECVLLLPLQRCYYHQLRKRITYYAPTRGGSIIAFILSLSSAQIILWRSIRYAFITLTPPMHITTHQEGCSELVFSTSWWFLIKHNKNHPRCGKTNTCIWYECNTIHSLTASDCWRTQSGMFKLLCMGNNKIGTLHYSSLCCSHHPWAISFLTHIDGISRNIYDIFQAQSRPESCHRRSRSRLAAAVTAEQQANTCAPPFSFNCFSRWQQLQYTVYQLIKCWPTT